MNLHDNMSATHEISILRTERDAYFQELFETNRHVAWLAQERQRLLDALANNPLHDEVNSLRNALNDTNRYVEWLESMITEKEDLRFILESQSHTSES